MRTTIAIDDALLDQLKVRAARENTTVSALIEEDVRLGELRRAQQSDPGRGRFRLRAFDLGRPNPGVDLNNNAALLDLMDNE